VLHFYNHHPPLPVITRFHHSCARATHSFSSASGNPGGNQWRQVALASLAALPFIPLNPLSKSLKNNT
jgi:hypothetical protein